MSEFLGTLLLVFFAVGSAVLGAQYIGTVGIALAFGFVLLALAYALGPISGCHLNPAVTLGMLTARRIDARTAVTYWIMQFLGGIAGAALLFLLASLAVIHLVGIPLTGTSANPARSLGPALFAGGAALSQLWLFLVAPLIGGVIAAFAHRLTHPVSGRLAQPVRS
ncbi:aquaporin [Streptomyces sp. NPDC050529]|uniref:aquaporin n=1 Tax=Streptomyces sp. NPDC050529 TaxID=3365624 RepID=UPI0037A269F4